MIKALALLAIAAATFTAQAETYFYAGGTAICSLTATRQSVGQSPVTVGSMDEYYGFQLFQSENYSSRLTAFTAGTNQQVSAMLAAGGIPNANAAQNWTIPDYVTSFSYSFSVYGVFTFPVAFNSTPDTNDMTGRIHVAWTLDMAQKILAAMKDTSAPNFQLDPPIVSWTTPEDLDFSFVHAPFEQRATNLGAGYEDHRAISDVQVHYPIDQHNGLSYHFIVTCE